MTRSITVKIVADTREFRRGIALARLALERSWWRTLTLRWELWRIAREVAP